MDITDCINRFCPNSGKPVVAEGLAIFRGATVGFCNSHCRDVFVANPDTPSKAREYFLVLLKEKASATA
jgi:hypothetical protein